MNSICDVDHVLKDQKKIKEWCKSYEMQLIQIQNLTPYSLRQVAKYSDSHFIMEINHGSNGYSVLLGNWDDTKLTKTARHTLPPRYTTLDPRKSLKL